ncbi:hypothetical protein [Tenacibaculum jejuense]|uniref:Uncharacterized protein n=1 Tax=Tenacibaculum jejuense TaxID=584609 RepID=A0A238UA62_9FLAO|nr:hypothetical protein [Tenacibaculum jejuense]SNR15992.1 protein of unknown function [Tenacibaculum jejuense]
MIKQLITDFFQEIETREFKSNKNSKTDFWVNELQKVDYNDENYIGKRKAERYYKKYVEEKDNVSVKIPNEYQRNFIANYLGYETFRDYETKNTSENNSKTEIHSEVKPITKKTYTYTPIKNNRKKQIYLISGLLFLSSIFIKYLYFNQTNNNFIKWNNNRFENALSTDENVIDNSIYKIDIENFQKVDLDTSYTFFTKGVANYWYGKNTKNVREFFSARGIHPETTKELKPITREILNLEGLLNE